MTNASMRINEDFQEIDVLSVDSRNRITVGKCLGNYKRVKVFKDSRGNILLIPLVEVPAAEMWLYQNKKALASVKHGLKDAEQGCIKKIELSDL